MKRRLAFLILVTGAIYVAYGLWISSIKLSVYSSPALKTVGQTFYDYSGVINIHSIASSGSGEYDTIVEAAKETGVDYIVITDSSNFKPNLELEKYYDKTLLIVGGEYSFFDSRIINFGFKNTEHLSGPGRTQLLISEILSKPERADQAGIFVLAHPHKAGYAWRGALPAGLNGIELFNLKSIWQSAWLRQKPDFFATLFLYPLHPEWAFLRMYLKYPQPEINTWDNSNSKKLYYGFAGADADARVRIPGNRILKFPSYQTSFSILKNHIQLRSELTGSFESDRAKILEALSRGNFYVSLDLIDEPRGFTTYVLDQNEKMHLMGQTVRNAKSIVVDLGQKPDIPFEVLIYQNGEIILTSTSVRTEHKVMSPGVYRVVVRVRMQFPFPEGREWLTWIVANPFAIN